MARWQERLGAVPGVRREPATRLHLTLRFLGDTATDLVPPLGEAMSGAAAVVPRLDLRLGAAGGFPSLRRPRVLWLGLEGDLESLRTLRAALDARLATLGVPPDPAAFHPHLTIARLRPTVRSADRRRLAERMAQDAPSGRWQVREVTLFRSILSRGSTRHVALANAPLGRTASSRSR